VSEARGQAYTELYWKLYTKEGTNDIYKMTKLRERKIRDFNQVKCIKDEADRENTSTNYSTMRVRKPRLSWTTQLTPTDDLFGEFKSLR
jgi:hypothetical protein